MAVEWLIKKNAETAVSLATAGVSECSLGKRANGVDVLAFTVEGDYAADPAFPFGSRVALIRRESATDVCVFVGDVRSIPRQAEGGAAETLGYEVEGPSAALQRSDYAQQWKIITADDGEPADAYEPRVILGENAAGARITTGAQISAVVAFAASRGVAVAVGTIDAGISAPLDERENVSCWDAITSCLRWTPRHVLWWDYNNVVSGAYVPACHVTASASMSAASVTLHDGNAQGAAFRPRYDLQVAGVLITYRIVGEHDGVPYERRSYDTAGTSDHAERVSLVFDMAGRSTEQLTQKVVVGTYPLEISAEADKQWLIGFVPWLGEIPLADWSVESWARDGAEEYTKYLTEGAISSWMSVGSERETHMFAVRYKTRDESNNIVDEAEINVPVTLLSTNASTKTYRKTVAVAYEEAVPSGFAASLYAEWSPLQWEGQFRIAEDECSCSIRPGVVCNFAGTGTRAEWQTMRGVVQDVRYNIDAGDTDVTVGPCARLEADSRMALFRAARGRRFARSRQYKADGAIDGTSGPDNTPFETTADSPAQKRYRLRVEAPDGDSNAHVVDINPAGTTFAVAGNKAATSITTREVVIATLDGSGNPVAKRVQALCSAPYGDAIPQGSSIPDGTAAGQLLRWNATSSDWEAAAATEITVVTAWRLDKTNHKFQVKTRTAKVLDPAAESAWTDITDANGGILDAGVPL